MNAVRQQLLMSLRLYYRNTMALIYGYLFPTVFLLAFFVLYRYERVPLVRHMGELLTVAVLGGACFGLPTTLVSERERGVWRRYRLSPVSTGSLVASTVLARYVILLTAGLLQLVLALLVGMPWPRHPFDLFVAFSLVSFAFLGLGLVIATLADNVPAVQALGQVVFLPMLIIGGVAVQLASLPDWAQHLSAFFPGRYAVEALQACVNGNGLGATGFALAALALIGAAGCLAGSKLFRWDAQQRFVSRSGKAWVGVALAAWVAVGLAAEARGRIGAVLPFDTDARSVSTASGAAAPASTPQSPSTPSGAAQPLPSPNPAPGSTLSTRTVGDAGGSPTSSATADRPAAPRADSGPSAGGASAAGAGQPASANSNRATGDASGTPAGTVAASGNTAGPAGATASAGVAPVDSSGATQPQPPTPPSRTASPDTIGRGRGQAAGGRGSALVEVAATRWQDVTMKMIDDEISFNRLPPDGGVVTPIADASQQIDQDSEVELDQIMAALPSWPPATVSDPLQRARNVLLVAGAVDVMQLPIEPFVPLVVFERLQQDIPQADLVKVLFWIAIHPDDGDDSALGRLRDLGLSRGPGDVSEVRGRAALYAVKLLGKITGKRK